MIEDCFGVQNQDENLTKCENRALPLHNANLDHLRKQNLRQINGNNLENNCDGTAEKDKGTFIKKSPQRQLYEILLAPVEDILLKVLFLFSDLSYLFCVSLGKAFKDTCTKYVIFIFLHLSLFWFVYSKAWNKWIQHTLFRPCLN